jgi:hypothetical protein
MLLVLCALGLASLVSCTTAAPVNPIQVVGCAVESSLNTAFAASIATVLSCSNQAAISASIANKLSAINICSTASVQSQVKELKGKGKMKGIVGDLVCPIGIDAINSIVNGAVPAAWGCSVSVSDGVSAALATACAAAVPF